MNIGGYEEGVNAEVLAIEVDSPVISDRKNGMLAMNLIRIWHWVQ